MTNTETVSTERPDGHYWVRFGAGHEWEVMLWDGTHFWGTAGDGYRGEDFEVGPQVFPPTSSRGNQPQSPVLQGFEDENGLEGNRLSASRHPQPVNEQRILSALETQGEAAWYEWELGDEKPEGSVEVRWRYGDHGEQTYIGDAASIGWQYVAWWRPAPVPVTITPDDGARDALLAEVISLIEDDMYGPGEAEDAPERLAFNRACRRQINRITSRLIVSPKLSAAFSAKPGEQG